MTNPPTSVRDTSGVAHVLGEQLGRGGQGAVFSVKGHPLVIKLLSSTGQAHRQRLEEGLARVRRMPLEGLPVARPLRMLAPPHLGYVMELMTDMEPLSTLIEVPKAYQADLSPWYLDTGSLQRRLACLANAADILNQLNGRGLCYGDLSPDNVFISVDRQRDDVWLIDCDNLSHGVNQRTFYTPGYGAPELFRGHPADSLTDAWSLATLVFETLSIVHPFEGDDVHDGPPERQEAAFRAELPYIDHPSGESYASRGLPREFVFTRKLVQLSQACFAESVTDRLQRPGALDWARALRVAADQVIVCEDCGSGAYCTHRTCPWCGAPAPTFITATRYLRDPRLTDPQRNPFNLVCREAGKPSPLHRLLVQAGRPVHLDAQSLELSRADDALSIALEGEALRVTGRAGCDGVLMRQGDRCLDLDAATHLVELLSDSRPWWLIASNSKGPHPALRFSLHSKRAL